jgi:hypothetical protein
MWLRTHRARAGEGVGALMLQGALIGGLLGVLTVMLAWLAVVW